MTKPHDRIERSPEAGLRSSFSRIPRRPADEAALEEEIRQEKARTLGRVGEALQEACRLAWELQRAAAAGSEDAAAALPAARERALALRHHLLLQREAVGLRDHEDLERHYPIPGDPRRGPGEGVS